MKKRAMKKEIKFLRKLVKEFMVENMRLIERLKQYREANTFRANTILIPASKLKEVQK